MGNTNTPKTRMPSIQIGDPQPIQCDNCGGYHGYQYTDYLSIHYDTIHLSNGTHEGGTYSDSQKLINAGQTAFCPNCGERLRFKINRKNDHP